MTFKATHYDVIQTYHGDRLMSEREEPVMFTDYRLAQGRRSLYQYHYVTAAGEAFFTYAPLRPIEPEEKA